MNEISIKAEPIFTIGSFAVTNTLLTTWVVIALLIILGLLISHSVKKSAGKVPGKLQNASEAALDTFLNFMTTVAGSREKAVRFLPIVGTIFFFILAANWAGIIPGVGSIGFYHLVSGKEVFVPYFRSANSDLNTTLALALIVVTLSQIVGFAVIGTKEHISKYICLTSPIDFFVGILEILGEFTRIISFSFRLFGNVFAGEVLLTIITFLVPYILPVPFLGLELFVGIIQALIFATLAMMFLSTATEAHEQH